MEPVNTYQAPINRALVIIASEKLSNKKPKDEADLQDKHKLKCYNSCTEVWKNG